MTSQQESKKMLGSTRDADFSEKISEFNSEWNISECKAIQCSPSFWMGVWRNY